MKKYIGTKIIKAEPMSLGEFIEFTGRDPYHGIETPHERESEGYRVRYEDGYESWSPKDVFEKAYHELMEDQAKTPLQASNNQHLQEV